MAVGYPPHNSVSLTETFHPLFFAFDVLHVPGLIDEVPKTLQICPDTDIYHHERIEKIFYIGVILDVADKTPDEPRRRFGQCVDRWDGAKELLCDRVAFRSFEAREIQLGELCHSQLV